ncbi:DUF2157 domain-containing protein [Fibrobacter sp. UWB11]|uniref:DUF2157 domain-containing protein n=1 Tax=Fibrobacter sp. UWB11 TaxID=1896202 RepID=UPI0009284487|nr:DUF2157 domain-containing protein [Fibrobacter sp. UWB11]SIO28433.1 Predicted membrane protein [Fibrobacter sp. UWB11]
MDDSITLSGSDQAKTADAKAWIRFVQVLTLTLGSGLMLAGIIFFFAYNWEQMHRFVKMGIAVALILAVFAVAIKVKMSDFTHKITLSVLCGLVGVFWAIFGQVYQTKADSYVFFLTWALCILAWVFFADFYPLWAVFIVLASMGVIPLIPSCDWHSTLLMLYGAAWILFFVFAPKYLPRLSAPPSWFTSALFTVEFGVAVFTVCYVTVKGSEAQNLLMAFAVAAATIWYALKQKDIWLYSMLFIGALSVLECVYFRCLLPTFGLFYQIMMSAAALGGASFAIVRQNEKWKQEESGTSTNQSVMDNGKQQP